MKRKTLEKFIEDARKIHGDRYDYSKFVYKGCSKNGIIICSVHREFEQTPSNHLRNNNCPKCLGRNKTTQDFIKEAKLIHGDKYNYSLTNYKLSSRKIIIICAIHGKFNQTANSHLNGEGCSKCGGTKKITKKEFVINSRKIHGTKYNYSKFKYINANAKGIIVCKNHGSFLQTPSKHITRKQGCPKCGGKTKLTLKEFIERSNKIHNNTYDYSKFIYVNYNTKGIIICKTHGEFLHNPNDHLSGSNGCNKCTGTQLTIKDFIERAKTKHGNRFDYSKFKYINTETKSIIICPEHKEFEQTPYGHLNSNGCPMCAGKNKTNEIFIKEAELIHGNKYNYSLVDYIKSDKEIIIICSIHGIFNQIPNTHLQGTGCTLCSPNKRINEKIVKKFLNNNNIIFKNNFVIKLPLNTKKNSKTFVDFYIPSLNLFIEYNGAQHYEPVKFGGMTDKTAMQRFKRQKKRDKQLKQYCKDNNINFFEIDGRTYKYKKLIQYLTNYFQEQKAA